MTTKIDLDKCDLAWCNNSWAYRVCGLDLCEYHNNMFKEYYNKIEKR